MAKERFEDILSGIEKLVTELESGDLTLADSLAKYEKAAKALKRCYEMLRNAEKRIEKLVKSADGSFSVEPFEPEVKGKGKT